ncbi:MAG: hypothetical protein KA978_29565, partial [Deltaproteobacteria bacterium]|nr:hypothetical protein [Deltaproteobacteria bacterium]
MVLEFGRGDAGHDPDGYHPPGRSGHSLGASLRFGSYCPRYVREGDFIIELYGNTTGLSPSDKNALERIYRRRVPSDRIVSPELAKSLAEASAATGRQVGAMVNRTGAVEHVIVGDAHKLML